MTGAFRIVLAAQQYMWVSCLLMAKNTVGIMLSSSFFFL